MFQYPYQTTPCSAYVLTGIVSALQHAAIEGQLVAAQTGKNVPIEGLFEVPPYVKSVAPFAHPLSIEVSGKHMLVIDTRAFTRDDRNAQQIRVTNPNEYEFLNMRGRLTKAWNEGFAGDLASVGIIAPQVFTRLISESLVRRLGLNPNDQQYLAAITAYYYFCQFVSQATLNEDEAAQFAQKISRVTNISTTTILQFMDALCVHDGGHKGVLPVLTDIHSFVAAIQKVGSSPRLESLNAGLVYASVTGIWFGANAREIVAVGLEYPPTWISLIYMALTDRTFHGAQLTKMVEACNKRDAGKDFVKNLANLMEMTSHA